jgi:hypothetical protein
MLPPAGWQRSSRTRPAAATRRSCDASSLRVNFKRRRNSLLTSVFGEIGVHDMCGGRASRRVVSRWC